MTANPIKTSEPARATTRPSELPTLSAEQVALLVEESSLGTAGARQLRDRTPPHTNEVIKARAFITRTDPDWWRNHHDDAKALVTKAEEVALDRWAVALTLLRLAAQLGHPEAAHAINSEDRSESTVASGSATPRQHQIQHDFADFHREHMGPLTDVLRSETGVSEKHARMAMVHAMTWAFDEWEELRDSERPEDLVLGRALRHCRLTAEGRASSPNEGRMGTRDTGLRMTGALTVAADPVRAEARARAAIEKRDADHAVTVLYTANYRSLVRLAALLVRDASTAEQIVQDAFVAMHGGWRHLRNPDVALSYLRRSVVNRSRSVLRHRAVVEKYAAISPKPSDPAATAIGELERSAVIEALTKLPTRQREALVLRYYADLSTDEIANAMGVSARAVKVHIRRGMAALRSVLETFTSTTGQASTGEDRQAETIGR